ncbi:MAG: hypothetical protein CK425_02165 [Parachlamydia sp.]|nr:MAG: hypothetical protein CK425_02165 [Parachlamydia sp.]
MPLPIAAGTPPEGYNSLSEAAKAFTAKPKEGQYLVKVDSKWLILDTNKLDNKTRQLVAKSFKEMEKETISVVRGSQRLPQGVEREDAFQATLKAAKINKKNYVKATDSKKKGLIEKVMLSIRKQTSNSIKKQFNNFASLNSMQETKTNLQAKKMAAQERIAAAERQFPEVVNKLINALESYPTSRDKGGDYYDITSNFSDAKNLIQQIKASGDEKKATELDQSINSLKEKIAPIAIEQFKIKCEELVNKLKEDKRTGVLRFWFGQLRGNLMELGKFIPVDQQEAVIKELPENQQKAVLEVFQDMHKLD